MGFLKEVDLNKMAESKIFKFIIVGIALLIILLLVFKLGMIVGGRKAEFTGKWSENYHRNFAGPRDGFMGMGLGDGDFIEANGVVGQIIKIGDDSIVIKGRDNVEKSLIVDAETIIKKFKDSVKISELKTDDIVVVIGDPNSSGQIQAKLIRILPPPSGTPFNQNPI
jgi:hypothetical protein